MNKMHNAALAKAANQLERLTQFSRDRISITMQEECMTSVRKLRALMLLDEPKRERK